MTERQRRFSDEYLIDLNATRAYMAAYPSIKRVHTAETNGSRMLRNAEVSAYIQERISDRQRRTGVTQDRVIDELAAIGFAGSGEGSPPAKDRVRALELLGKHLGLFDQQRKDDLDREEQRARIAKLRSDTRIVEGGGEGGIIFMPTMEDRPTPPEDDE